MTTIVAKRGRMHLLAILFRRQPREVPKSNGNRRAKRGDPSSRNVSAIIARCEAENATDTTRIMRAITTLLRCGDPTVVHGILGGRGIDERVIEDHEPQPCEWCESEAPEDVPIQPTSVRITGDREYTECCRQSHCFHAALQWVDAADDSGDRDIVVELAKRTAVTL